MKESFLEINQANLIHNFNWYKKHSKSGFLCPMIKANAYGVGEDIIFHILNPLNPSAFGVVRLSEALSVRKKNSKVKILMFNPCDKSDYLKVVDQSITPVISSLSAIKDLDNVLESKNIKSYPVHIEIDTGMNRLGIKPDQISDLFKTLLETKNISVEGVFSHFLSAEDWPERSGKCFTQLNVFEEIVELFNHFKIKNKDCFVGGELIYHLSSSKALNDDGLAQENNSKLTKYGFRPGLGLFGISQRNSNLKPVLNLKSPVIDLKWIEKGETVSYDGIWSARQRSLIATLPLGYGDGYPRALAEKSHVLIYGKKVPVIGKICMDFMMIDVTGVQDQVKIGDLAVVFGYESDTNYISIEDLSELAGMITYELIVRLSSRLLRQKA